MAALWCFDESYLNAGGDLTLEEGLIGRVKPKAGNLARRLQSEERWRRINVEMNRLIRDGVSVKDAAKKISTQFDGKPNEETIEKYTQKTRQRQRD